MQNPNPWLEIPADDYEHHMSSPEVEQLQALNTFFKKVLAEFRPASIAVIGCTTGNGFEHIDPGVTKRALEIDINQEYLDIAEKRHRNSNKELPCDTFLLAWNTPMYHYLEIL